MTLRASKVSVDCHCSPDSRVQIVPAAAIVRPKDDEHPAPIAAWLCPGCGCAGGSSEPAMVTLLQLAGARPIEKVTAAFRHPCPSCNVVSLVDRAEIVMHLGHTENDVSMRRIDCPVCARVSIEVIPDTLAISYSYLGVRTVTDALDLVPEEADALTDPSVDLHELLLVALATQAPSGD